MDIQVQHWVRYELAGGTGFGTLIGDTIHEHRGDMFDRPAPTGRMLALDAVRLLSPTQPSRLRWAWTGTSVKFWVAPI